MRNRISERRICVKARRCCAEEKEYPNRSESGGLGFMLSYAEK
jgi:hypothetical protein